MKGDVNRHSAQVSTVQPKKYTDVYKYLGILTEFTQIRCKAHTAIRNICTEAPEGTLSC